MKVVKILLFWLIKGILSSVVIKYPKKMKIEGIRSLETHSIPTEEGDPGEGMPQRRFSHSVYLT